MPAAQCIGGEELQPLVVGSSSWNLVTEGTPSHPKPGLVSQAIGASLRLCYPLQRVCEASGCPSFGLNRSAKVAVGYLKSWDHKMGVVNVTCEDGCSCTPRQYNGHHNVPTSVLTVEHVVVTTIRKPTAMLATSPPTPCECTLRFEVVPPPPSTAKDRVRGVKSAGGVRSAGGDAVVLADTGTKFKVSMMMLSDGGDLTWADPWKTQWLSTGDALEFNPPK